MGWRGSHLGQACKHTCRLGADVGAVHAIVSHAAGQIFSQDTWAAEWLESPRLSPLAPTDSLLAPAACELSNGLPKDLLPCDAEVQSLQKRRSTCQREALEGKKSPGGCLSACLLQVCSSGTKKNTQSSAELSRHRSIREILKMVLMLCEHRCARRVAAEDAVVLNVNGADDSTALETSCAGPGTNKCKHKHLFCD